MYPIHPSSLGVPWHFYWVPHLYRYESDQWATIRPEMIYVIYLNPVDRPRARSPFSAILLSRMRCIRYTHTITADIKAAKIQTMNDFEYDGPHEATHRYLYICKYTRLRRYVLATHDPPISPRPENALTNANATARLAAESGIELLTHAIAIVYETDDWAIKKLPNV